MITGVIFLLHLSSSYILKSRKVTPVLEISYKWLNLSIIIAFVLMTIYAAYNVFNEILIFMGKKTEPSLIQEEK